MAITVTEIPTKLSLTGNRIPVSLSTDLAGANITFPELHLKVKYLNNGEYVEAGHMSKPVVNGSASFDIRTYLDKKTTPEFAFPEHSVNLIIQRPNMVIQFKLSYFESYLDKDTGLIENTDEVEGSEVFYSLQGGIPEDLEILYNEANTDFFTELLLNKQFLTWHPEEMEVSPKQTVKLYWLQPDGSTQVKLQIRKKTTEGETTQFLKELPANPWEVVELCIGPELLALDESVQAYIIYLTNQDNEVISEERSFVIIRDWFERNDFFIFQNSLGCFDTLWARGQKKEKIEIDRLKYSKKLPNYPGFKNRRIYSNRGSISKKRTSEIGLITNEAFLEYLQEFLLTENAYWLDGSIPWAINNITDRSDLTNDKEDYWTLPFEWEPAMQNRYFARHRISLRAPLPPFWEDVVCVFDRRIGNQLIDRKNGYKATITSTGIEFPEITNNDVFNKTNATYWLADIPNTYGNDRGWLYDELIGTFTILYNTETCRGQLFFKDIQNNVRTTLPIIVYKRILTDAEQEMVVKYLEEYFFVTDNGVIVKDNDDFVIIK